MAKAQTTATLRYLRMSPRKVRLLVDLVRGMKADEAITQLSFANKQAARPLVKLIRSGMANAAHNHQIDTATLVITKAFVDGGPMAYRYTPRAFGRATPVRRRTAHITVVLEGETLVDKKAAKVSAPETTAPEQQDEKTVAVKKTRKPQTKKTTTTRTKSKK